MSETVPRAARRWLAEEMVRWAAWKQHPDNVACSGYPSLVGWLIGSSLLEEEELAAVQAALDSHAPDPV